jgi:transcription termination factor Rho
LSETDLVSTESAPEGAGAPTRRRAGLTGMVLAELRQLAGELNIPDTAGMRKGDLIAAIKERQGGSVPAATRAPAAQLSLGENGADAGPVESGAAESAPVAANGAAAESPSAPTRRRRAASRPAGAPDPQLAAGSSANGAAPGESAATSDGASAQDAAFEGTAPQDVTPLQVPTGSGATVTAPAETDATASPAGSAPAAPTTGTELDPSGDGVSRRTRQGRSRNRGDRYDQADAAAPAESDGAPADSDADRGQRGDGRRTRGDDRGRPERGDNRPDNRADGRTDNRPDTRTDRGRPNDRIDDDSDDDGDGRGRRGRRFRDRRRGRDRERPGSGGAAQGGGQGNIDTEVRDGDVLLPVAGIIDVLDNYAFVRTTGYLSGPTDVYVSLSMVRKYGLRRGDAITGAVREAREGEQTRQKFNPLVRVDSINGQDPENSRNRPEFTKLTPLYPNERLRLETEPHKLTTRVIDLVMPIGKGQRALIVSPPKAGKTMVLQSIANAITTNNPECHLMVVLVDERPEEVTDMTRSVKGEVIASTFDRPPGDHTTVAELAIERAKRLVEMGHDVVVLLDSITRLGRAYNLAAPASGRILSGGVDSTALYPPKRFLGAARNIEDGGSLTIFATALVETGSTMDTVIFEEFKGTGNAELKLDRRIADKRVFPAIDVDASGTRKEELLLSPDELAVTVKLRRVLSALDDQQAIDLLLTQLRKTRTNIEFLMQVAKSTPGGED